MDPLLVTALFHPKRAEILAYLMRTGTSCGSEQLAIVVDLPPHVAKYHLRVLTSADLTFRVKQEPGHAEHTTPQPQRSDLAGKQATSAPGQRHIPSSFLSTELPMALVRVGQ